MERNPAVIFVVVCCGAIASACGRQVTPNPPGLGAGGAPLGYTALFFNVAAPFNFSNYQYMFVLNTSGSRITPSTDTRQTNWPAMSSHLSASGNGIASAANVINFALHSRVRGLPAG